MTVGKCVKSRKIYSLAFGNNFDYDRITAFVCCSVTRPHHNLTAKMKDVNAKSSAKYPSILGCVGAIYIMFIQTVMFCFRALAYRSDSDRLYPMSSSQRT